VLAIFEAVSIVCAYHLYVYVRVRPCAMCLSKTWHSTSAIYTPTLASMQAGRVRWQAGLPSCFIYLRPNTSNLSAFFLSNCSFCSPNLVQCHGVLKIPGNSTPGVKCKDHPNEALTMVMEFMEVGHAFLLCFTALLFGSLLQAKNKKERYM